jgi:zinc-finger of transposase IS204/IS1001/IS1096/IS1165
MSLSLSGNCLSCGLPCGLGVLLPHLAGVVEQVDRLPGLVCLSVRARGEEGICPRCGAGSSRVHGRYERRLADAAVGGQQMVIRLRVRRFFCDVPGCPACTFAGQVEGLTTAYARRTPLLRGMQEAIALALAGRAGARLAARFGLPAGRSTMLGWSAPCPTPPQLTLPCSGWMISRSGAGMPTAACWWTWARTGRRTCCPTGKPSRSPAGCAPILAAR